MRAFFEIKPRTYGDSYKVHFRIAMANVLTSIWSADDIFETLLKEVDPNHALAMRKEVQGDPLLNYVIRMRADEDHTVPGSSLGPFTRSEVVWTPLGYREFYVREPMALRPVSAKRNGPRTVAPPTEHRGEKLDEVTPELLVNLAAAWYLKLADNIRNGDSTFPTFEDAAETYDQLEIPEYVPDWARGV